MTLQEKLDAFQRGTAVLHTPTQEIFSKLMETIRNRRDIRGFVNADDWWLYRENTVVDYVQSLREYGFKGLGREDLDYFRDYFPELDILEVTEADLGILSPFGIQKRMQEINGHTNNIVICHVDADELLCDILEQQGFHEVVKWFERLDKGYAR